MGVIAGGGDMGWNQVWICRQRVRLSVLGLLVLASTNQAQEWVGGLCRSSLSPVTAAASDRFVESVSSRLHQSRLPQAPSQGLSGLLQRSNLLSGSKQRGLSSYTPGSVMAAGRGTSMFSNSPIGVWGKGYGLYGERDAKSSISAYNYGVMGAAGGLDLKLSDYWLVGTTAGFSGGNIEYAGLTDTTQLSAMYGGLYASFSPGACYVDAMVTGARLGYQTDRYTTPGSQQSLTGTFGGWQGATYLESGLFLLDTEAWSIQPLAGLRYAYTALENYTETGGTSALSFGKQNNTSLRGSLGMKVTRRFSELMDLCDGHLELRARWNHEFQDTHATVEASPAGHLGSVLMMADGQLPRNSAMLGAGLQLDTAWGSRIRFHYDTRLSAEDQAHIFSGQAEIRW